VISSEILHSGLLISRKNVRPSQNSIKHDLIALILKGMHRIHQLLFLVQV
jgi:hypothetical protein